MTLDFTKNPRRPPPHPIAQASMELLREDSINTAYGPGDVFDLDNRIGYSPVSAPYVPPLTDHVCATPLDHPPISMFSPRKTATPSTAAISPPTKGSFGRLDLATHRAMNQPSLVPGDVAWRVAIDSIYGHALLSTIFPLNKMSFSNDDERRCCPFSPCISPPLKKQASRRTLQHDPEHSFKEFMVRNTYIYPPVPSMPIIGDNFANTS